MEVFVDEDEWRGWGRLGDTVLHIELRKWADAFLLFPASPHYIAKLNISLTDDLIACVCRAWPSQSKPLLVFPSAHPYIARNPLLSHQLAALEETQKIVVVTADTVEDVIRHVDCAIRHPPTETPSHIAAASSSSV